METAIAPSTPASPAGSPANATATAASAMLEVATVTADLRDATLKLMSALQATAVKELDDQLIVEAAHHELDQGALKLHLAHAFIAKLAHHRSQQVKRPTRGAPRPA